MASEGEWRAEWLALSHSAPDGKEQVRARCNPVQGLEGLNFQVMKSLAGAGIRARARNTAKGI
jgi:hypothetical protein